MSTGWRASDSCLLVQRSQAMVCHKSWQVPCMAAAAYLHCDGRPAWPAIGSAESQPMST